MARYDDFKDKDFFIYVLTCSERSLGNLLLTLCAEDQQLTKDLFLAFSEMIDKKSALRWRIRLVNLVRDHGAEFIERLSGVAQRLPAEPHKTISLPAKRIKA